MATRTLPSERDRKMTILLTPFMSCSAKLPIYAFFVSAFFPKHGGLVMGGLYFIGIIVGILFAFIYRKTLFRGDAVPFVMELPNYRMPGARNVCQLLWEKAKDFLQKAFTVILIATMLIWFLQSFDIHFNMVTDSKDSMLAAISSVIVPVFKPLDSATGAYAHHLSADSWQRRAWYQHLRYCLAERLRQHSQHFQPHLFWCSRCSTVLAWLL